MDTRRVASAFAVHRVTAVVEWMTRLTPGQAALVTCIAIAAIAVADWLTKPHFAFGGLYILPMCLAAWSIGLKAGLVTGLASAAITVSLNGAVGLFDGSVSPITGLAAAWNIGMRLFVVAFIVILVASFRHFYEAERRRGQIDPLTGAYNRHALDTLITASSGIARRHDLTLILTYLDLDGFKAVNDNHGHAAGDEVLRTFSAAAAAAIRQSDSLCRIGGDEFVILLTAASSAHGYAAAEHLHMRLTRILAALPYDVTCSMGAVVMEGNVPADPAQFIGYADALMYEVKKNGKNALRIAVAPATPARESGGRRGGPAIALKSARA